MANGLVLIDRYTPKVGAGGALREALEFKNKVWLEQGYPGFSIWKPFDGPHNSLVTVQRWPDFSEWENTRGDLPKNAECRSAVFDVLYPTNETPYYTTYYQEIL